MWKRRKRLRQPRLPKNNLIPPFLMSRITPQSKDFSQWYLDVIKEADLAEYAPVKGCMIIKPYGYAIWERIQAELDRRIKEAGVQNAYFPLFIPQSFLQKEKSHVEGFSPECAVVTHGGGKELTEPLFIRPTSETIMYDTFSRWIKSYRDLPLKINQWANVVRWEMRTRLFLRTTEFLWQEGHTAHADKAGADAEAHRALDMYASVARDFFRFPVLHGMKTAKEMFKGALYTMSIEALAKDGKAIQAGTSHNLGTNFARAFEIRYQDEKGVLQEVWQTSWGVSTRLIGTLIVVHGDDAGLRLSSDLAPVQVVIVPIWKTDAERKQIHKMIDHIRDVLPGVRLQVDDRDGVSAGFKFNFWDAKGVPLRIEIGPRDLAAKSCMVALRKITKDKRVVKIDALAKKIPALLQELDDDLFTTSDTFLQKNMHQMDDYASFKKQLETDIPGFILAPWCGHTPCEQAIQDETKATIRVLSEKNPAKNAVCIRCGKKAQFAGYFAKAY